MVSSDMLALAVLMEVGAVVVQATAMKPAGMGIEIRCTNVRDGANYD